MAREWGKVAFNPDAICYTSVSQGGKCDVFMWVWREKKPFGCRPLVKWHRPAWFLQRTFTGKEGIRAYIYTSRPLADHPKDHLTEPCASLRPALASPQASALAS